MLTRVWLIACLLLGWVWGPAQAQAVEHEAWRVLSQRIVLPAAARELSKRLRALGVTAQLRVRREAILLHVFDDPRIYADHASAARAQARWRKLGIAADILPVDAHDHRFRIGLGRYYLDAYALAFQEDLKARGLPFVYHRMRKRIPVYRIVFPAQPHDEAMALWRKLHQAGINTMLLMRERDFRANFADLQPSSATKRSNK